MVIAKFTMDEKKKQVSLHVKGHAGQNAQGNDIICASASILAYTVAQNVQIAQERGMLKYSPTIKSKSGDFIITCRAIDDDAYSELLHTYLVVQTGYQVLAHNYPQYAAVETFGEAE
jgi:uncharacterized protein YsxB (DUF464 family)